MSWIACMWRYHKRILQRLSWHRRNALLYLYFTTVVDWYRLYYWGGSDYICSIYNTSTWMEFHTSNDSAICILQQWWCSAMWRYLPRSVQHYYQQMCLWQQKLGWRTMRERYPFTVYHRFFWLSLEFYLTAICEGDLVIACSGNGRCNSSILPHRCVCDAQWAGTRCETRKLLLHFTDSPPHFLQQYANKIVWVVEYAVPRVHRLHVCVMLAGQESCVRFLSLVVYRRHHRQLLDRRHRRRRWRLLGLF